MTPYYEQDGIVIYHGDCREVLPSLAAGAARAALGETRDGSQRLAGVGPTGTSGSAQGQPAANAFDLLLTDPPYGIGEARGKNKSRTSLAVSKDYGVSDWDDSPPPRWLLDLARSLAKHQIIFGGNYFELPPARCWLVWDKDNGANDFADCELAWTNLDKAVRRLTYRQQGMLTEPGCPKEYREHPTQKPEAVMRWALLLVPDAQSVLDPFMGSGTTLVACKRLGRSGVGIERDERYCEVAAQRLSQGALFAGCGRSVWEETA